MDYQKFEDEWEDVLKKMFKDLEGSVLVFHEPKTDLLEKNYTEREREEVYSFLESKKWIVRDSENKFKIYLTPTGGEKAEILVHPWKGWIKKGWKLVKKHAVLAIIGMIAASGILGGLSTTIEGLIKIVTGI